MAASVIPIRYRLRLKQRLAVVTFAEEHGIKPAGRHFGIDHKTVREWRKRWRHAGERDCSLVTPIGGGADWTSASLR